MLTMLRDRVLVKPIERKLSEIIEVKNTDKFSLGEVMACGPKATDVVVGDMIRYGEFTFPEWKGPDGVTYQIIQEADVAAVVEA